MTLSQIPYLTIDLLEAGETQVLDYLPALFPQATPWVALIRNALPLIHTIPFERELLQGALDRINKLLGKTPQRKRAEMKIFALGSEVETPTTPPVLGTVMQTTLSNPGATEVTYYVAVAVLGGTATYAYDAPTATANSKYANYSDEVDGNLNI